MFLNFCFISFRLIDFKVEERQGGSASLDPVLGFVEADFESSQRLLEEIRETGVTRPDALKIVKDLCRKMNTMTREVAQQHSLHAGRSPLKKGDRVELEGTAPVFTLVYHRKKWKKPFCIKINASHFNKLRDMFVQVHCSCQDGDELHFSEGGKPTMMTHAFHLLLMVLLLRYSALSGGQLLLDLRGGGMQGAIHGEVFRVLRESFLKATLLEGFASPLNAYLPSFCSAFPGDLDWHFGSVGSFFSEPITEGCCEANPPFTPGIMTAMAQKIEENLMEADKRKSSLTFVVVVPNAGNSSDADRVAAKRFGGMSLFKMTSSIFYRQHILLSAKHHGYVEGSQHMRPTRYKESLYDTSVVVLQSRKARKASFDHAEFETKIREAFASRHEAEHRRRKGAENGTEQYF
jgi:phosphorylated CTD-interacting factor 1